MIRCHNLVVRIMAFKNLNNDFDFYNRQHDLARPMVLLSNTTYNTIPPPSSRTPGIPEEHGYGADPQQIKREDHGWG